MEFFRHCLLLPGLFFCMGLAAQNANPAISPAEQAAVNYFRQAVGPSSLLYTGTEYLRRGTRTTGHAYWQSDALQPADIWYKNNFFEQVPALFDLEKNQLVIEDYRKALLLQLVKESVDSFRMDNRLFICSGPTPASKTIYQQLQGGHCQLLCLRQKYLAPSPRAEENSLPFFASNDSYWLLVNQVLSPVNDEQDIIKLFPAAKDRIRSFIRSQKLRFRKDREDALVRLVQFINQTIAL